MAGLWMVVVLAFFLSAEHSLAAVEKSWLTSIVEAIKNEYGDSFRLAVNIPQNQDPDNLNQVLKDDPADRVKEVLSQGQVYKGSRVVAAGALSAVLQNITPFIKRSQGNVLIMYSPKANENGVAAKISDVTQNWSDYTFVFSKVAGVPDAAKAQLAQSFKHLEISILGLGNIFRCFKPEDDSFQCTSCSSGGGVAPSCVANTALSSQEQEADAEISVPESNRDMGTGILTGGGGGGELPSGQGKAGRIRKCKGRREGQCKRRGAGKRGKKGGRVRKGKRRNKGLKGGRPRRGGKGGRNKAVKWGGSRRGGKGKRRRKSRGRRRGFENNWVLLNLE